MSEEKAIKKLSEILNLPAEAEWIEFKEAKSDFSIDKLGKYFSALSNEANLRGMEFGWLIFGVKDDKSLIGSDFRKNRAHLDKLKGEISEHTTYRISFTEIHEITQDGKRILMFQIPAALRGIPTEWKGHFFGRDGENLVPLSEEKKERIRNQGIEEDWSAAICEDATIEDLDSEAVTRARELYIQKFPGKIAEIDSWDELTFLNKAKITIKGKITRTAIILLGKEESEHFVGPADLKIRWVLKDSKGVEQDWTIEGCPFLFAIERVYSKIRNVRYRYIKDGTLFPDEVDRYEPFVIREAVNNCIAHQDYSMGGRINVIEGEDHLIFTNLGRFIPGSVENVIHDDAPEERYRNKFLASAMVNLNLVDTIGSGIRKMFNFQRARFFPLPDYDTSESRVKVTIIGKVLDMDYAKILARDEELTLEEIMMLDKVQKRKSISQEEVRHLKSKGLVEGIKPNYFISAKLAKTTGQKAKYTKARGFDREKYFELIISCIKHSGHIDRKDINELLWDVLPSWMTDKQKYTKINHLIANLRSKNKIKNLGSDYKPKWVLTE